MVRARDLQPTRSAGIAVPFDLPVQDVTGPLDVVVVCTANVARSPLVERLLRSEFDALAPFSFTVRSCGTRAVAGRPMADGTRHILRSRGIRSDGFASRQLSAETLRTADLVLTAEVRHAEQVVDVSPGLLKKTFTVLELARIAAQNPIEAVDAREFIRRASALRFVAADADRATLDLTDPVGHDPSAFVDLERQLGDAAGTIARALVGAA